MERSGFCECGCGGKTNLATKTSRTVGNIKGQPLRYIAGHSAIGKHRGPKAHGIVKCVRCGEMKQFRAKGMCDACWQANRIEKLRAQGKFYTNEVITEKECYHCHIVKPVSNFKKNRDMRDGLQAWCDDCRHSHDKAKRTDPVVLENIRERSHNFYRKQNDAEKRVRHDANYEREKARMKEEPQYRKRKNFQSKQKNNRRERLLSKEEAGTYTLEEWEVLCTKYEYRCLSCKEKFTLEELTADHVIPVTDKSRPIAGRNTIANIQPLCRSCNSRKNNRYIDYR